jgi:hypothetical protein
MLDDPHFAFTNRTTLRATVRTLGLILDGFLADLAAEDDPGCPGSSLADNLVLSIHGDTPKHPLIAESWPDSTPDSTNWIYVLGAGWLKTGWYGGIRASGEVVGWDPATGAEAAIPSTANAAPAAAAVAYAVATGDMGRVRALYSGPDISGIVRTAQM